MSLLDSNIEIGLSPEILKNVFAIPIHIKVKTFDPPTEVVSSRGYYHKCYVEVWYPGSVYNGSLWVFKGVLLKENMVHISFIRDPRETNWMAREDMVFSGLVFDEFIDMMNALKNKDWEFLDILNSYKSIFPLMK